MERIIMMVIRNILRVPFLWIKLCYRAAHADKYTDKQHNEMFKYIVRRANIGGNVTIIQQKLAKKQVDDLTAKSNDIKKVDM